VRHGEPALVGEDSPRLAPVPTGFVPAKTTDAMPVFGRFLPFGALDSSHSTRNCRIRQGAFNPGPPLGKADPELPDTKCLLTVVLARAQFSNLRDRLSLPVTVLSAFAP